ncbi:MAG: FRG domain-containing protein [Thalassospira sp.]|uniref:FRG domain-containing protein n=1 Tax=Thalassospira sp. TaxID=1912094 RepID=UPI003A8B5306
MAFSEVIKVQEFDCADSVLLEFVKSSDTERLFRGQGDSTWGLAPSVCRDRHTSFFLESVVDERFPDGPKVFNEIVNLSNFLNACDRSGLRVSGDSHMLRHALENLVIPNSESRHVDPIKYSGRWPGNDRSILQFMAQAQHHGVSTRLLDWSKSPVVAIYFAIEQLIRQFDQEASAGDLCVSKVRELITDQKLAVFSLDIKSVNAYREQFTVVNVPGFTSVNLAAQQGVFTVMQGHETSELDMLQNKHLLHLFTKYTFPIRLVPELYEKCSLLGVNAATMYPGYDGAAKMCRQEVLIADLRQKLLNLNET